MNAYLFIACLNQFQKGRFVEWCCSLIVYGADEDSSQKAFEKSLHHYNEVQDSTPVQIERIIRAPFLDQIITETDHRLIDWTQICEEAEKSLPDAEGDTGHGYWMDCDPWVRAGQLSSGIEWLRRELPEDIQSGLNWSADKTYLFLISALRPPAPHPEVSGENQDFQAANDTEEGASEEWFGEVEVSDTQLPFPELVERELVVLVRARNSIVAAWLWRKFAATTPLAAHAIRIEAWCGAASLEAATG